MYDYKTDGMKQKAFTLLEILLVVAAIGILAAIVIVAINPQRQLAHGRDAKRKIDIKTINNSIEQYRIDNGALPKSIQAIAVDAPTALCKSSTQDIELTFYTRTDDGVRLFVDGTPVIDRWVNQGPTVYSGNISLPAGSSANIRMEYYENSGGAVAELEWEHVNQMREYLTGDDVDSLVSQGTQGFDGTYYSNMNFTGTGTYRLDDEINFDWGNGNVGPTLEGDTVSVRWEGVLQVPSLCVSLSDFIPTYVVDLPQDPSIGTSEDSGYKVVRDENNNISVIPSGAEMDRVIATTDVSNICQDREFTFLTRTDDGVRLWVNDTQIINRWVNQGPTTHSSSISLDLETRYPIVMEYYENGGGAVAELMWSYLGQIQQIIPSQYLFTGNQNGLGGTYYNNRDLTGTGTYR